MHVWLVSHVLVERMTLMSFSRNDARQIGFLLTLECQLPVNFLWYSSYPAQAAAELSESEEKHAITSLPRIWE